MNRNWLLIGGLTAVLLLVGSFPGSAFASIQLPKVPHPKAVAKSTAATTAVKTIAKIATTTATNTGNQSLEPVILVYHSVEPKTAKKEGKMQKHYHIYPEKFRAQMQYLKDNGYSPIPMKVYLSHLKYGTEIPKKSVVLTFDDGWKNQYEYAFPILKEFGYTGTFYIITGARGSGYMSWDEVKELDAAGMDVESHTKTHANLAKSSSEKIVQELTDSKKILEEKLGHPISMVAYPYYANNDTVHTLVQQAGYQSARAGWIKGKNGKENLFMLKSQEAVNSTNPFSSKPDSE